VKRSFLRNMVDIPWCGVFDTPYKLSKLASCVSLPVRCHQLDFLPRHLEAEFEAQEADSLGVLVHSSVRFQ
jgi:hypothetical protein